jgi:hypothetical protein
MAKSNQGRGANTHPAFIDQANFRRKDLVRACIIRGMPFDLAFTTSDFSMAAWHYHNYFNAVKPELLDEYDQYVDNRIKAEVSDWEKKDYLFDKTLKLGYTPEEETDEEGNTRVVKKRLTKIKIVKKKRERTLALGNIFQGTKKELTFRCAARGKTVEEAKEIVKKQFPDANEKSVKIWFKKAEKEVQRQLTMNPNAREDYEKMRLPDEAVAKQKVKIIISKEYKKKKARKARRK